MKKHEQTFIGGEWIEPAGGAVTPVENPTDGQVFAETVTAGAAELDRAVAAARTGFAAWSRTSREERADHLESLWRELLAREDELAATITSEVGTPLKISRLVQVGLPLRVLEATVRILREPDRPERIGNSTVLRDPVGVIGCITPWNYPLHQSVAKIAGALAAGCTVVHKPAELAPLNAFLLAEAIEAAGIPAGVYNLVPGPGSVIGSALAEHPGVDMMSFTGSTAVGSRVAAAAAANVKRVSLELGGKSASLVLDDADLERAVRVSVGNCFLNAGQTCSAWTRLIVPADRLAEAEEIARAAAERFVPGDPADEKTRLGPLISATQKETVTGHIRRAIEDGATLITGGPETPAGFETGHFVAPTVFSRVEPASALSREEVFGPVLAILAHEGDQDGLRIANDSPYGLGGAVWSTDEARAMAAAREMRTGQVDINGADFNPMAPFGGIGKSGYGREFGPFGIEEFTSPKAIQT